MRCQNILPAVYYDESRDFAFINRLQEIVFNYMKTAADNVKVGATAADTEGVLIDLTTNTLGFQPKHKYNTKDLIAVISVFNRLLRKKGSLEAIVEAVDALISTQNIRDKVVETRITHDTTDYLTIKISVPASLKDTILLEDLFEYILPAGIIYTFEVLADDELLVSELTAENAPGSTPTATNVSDRNLGSIDTSYTANTTLHDNYLGVIVSE